MLNNGRVHYKGTFTDFDRPIRLVRELGFKTFLDES